eukprot:3440766-Lingulodinium_polyedra.AAC.1
MSGSPAAARSSFPSWVTAMPGATIISFLSRLPSAAEPQLSLTAAGWPDGRRAVPSAAAGWPAASSPSRSGRPPTAA